MSKGSCQSTTLPCSSRTSRRKSVHPPLVNKLLSTDANIFFDVICLPLLIFTFLSMLTVDVLTKHRKGLCHKALTCQQSCQRASQICQHVHQNGQSGSFLITVNPSCSYLSTGLLTADSGSAASETGTRSHPRCVPYLS